jgi:hypothetical protein
MGRPHQRASHLVHAEFLRSSSHRTTAVTPSAIERLATLAFAALAFTDRPRHPEMSSTTSNLEKSSGTL